MLPKATPALIEEILRRKERMSTIGSRIGGYSNMLFSTNTTDEKVKALESRLSLMGAEVGNQTMFFGLWWMGLPKEKAQALLPKNPEYRHTLLEMRKFSPHMLSEKEEQLANLKDTTGEEALVKLYDIITNEFTFPWEKEGKTVMVPEEEIRAYIKHPNPKYRVRAYQRLWETYGAHNPVLGEIYRNLVLDVWNENVGLRKYERPISARNLGNNLTDKMVDTFLGVCRKNTKIFQDYFQWKTKELGVDYSRYHIYAPLPQPEKKWGFEEGYKHVMAAYRGFSPRMEKEAHRVLTQNRMDVPIRKGKRGGAYCAGITPEETSFVLLNWAGNYTDVSTLAHELGHAVHNHLSSSHSILNHHAPLPLAETASTFGEMLLADRMMEQNKEEGFTRYMLAHQVDDAYASIPRQAFFSLFEMEAFDLIREGKTIPDIHDAYKKNLQEQLGSMHLPENVSNEWTMIQHFFHYPFYVYAYAFGQLLVYALWEMYQEEGKSFVPRYETFLSYGGSEDPEKMLLEIGFDPNKKASWQKGFDLLEAKVKKLKAL